MKKRVLLTLSVLFLEYFSAILVVYALHKESIDLLRVSVDMALCGNVIYCLKDLRQRFPFLVFNISLFTLLMGRIAFYKYSEYYNYNYGMEGASPQTVIKVLMMIYLSLVFLLVGYALCSLYLNKKKEKKFSYNSERLRIQSLACLLFYYATFPFNVLVSLEKARFVQTTSYINYYSNYTSRYPSIVLRLNDFCPIAFCAYLACCPPKKEARFHILTYLALNSLSMLMGTRGNFILSLLLIVLYYVLRHRPEDPWINRGTLVLTVIAAPLLMMLMVYIKALRYQQVINNTIPGLLSDFFVQQGVSVKVLISTVEYKDELRKMAFYSLSSITDFLKGNAVTQLFFNFKVYRQNTVENALYSNHLANFLSYKLLGNLYLKGRGIGTSYIAELYADLNMLGVIIGNLFAGAALSWIPSKLFQNDDFFINTVLILMLREILFMPRDNFSSFVIIGINVTSLVAIFIMYMIRKGLKWIEKQ